MFLSIFGLYLIGAAITHFLFMRYDTAYRNTTELDSAPWAWPLVLVVYVVVVAWDWIMRGRTTTPAVEHTTDPVADAEAIAEQLHRKWLAAQRRQEIPTDATPRFEVHVTREPNIAPLLFALLATFIGVYVYMREELKTAVHEVRREVIEMQVGDADRARHQAILLREIELHLRNHGACP